MVQSLSLADPLVLPAEVVLDSQVNGLQHTDLDLDLWGLADLGGRHPAVRGPGTSRRNYRLRPGGCGNFDRCCYFAVILHHFLGIARLYTS